MKEKVKKIEWIASLPGCLALNSSDIGLATLEDNLLVITTWGRNLSAKKAKWYEKNTNFEPIKTGKNIFELILPNKDALKILRACATAHMVFSGKMIGNFENFILHPFTSFMFLYYDHERRLFITDKRSWKTEKGAIKASEKEGYRKQILIKSFIPCF